MWTAEVQVLTDRVGVVCRMLLLNRLVDRRHASKGVSCGETVPRLGQCYLQLARQDPTISDSNSFGKRPL